MKRAAFPALAMLFVLIDSASAQLPPEEALKTLTVAEGLEISLFASELMFSNPTCIDIDHMGRVWACESVNYRTTLRKQPPNRKEGDRIVILEDTDADGKADKAHTFYQAPDFIAPLGIAIAPSSFVTRDGKQPINVYICHSPHIYLFEDKDGDLKADGPPKILLTGFKGHDHDHGVHGIHIGPDGKLYFSVGDQGVDGLVDRFGKKWKSNNTDCRAGTIWRCDMDGKNLELLAHNFRNPYEPAVDSFGTMFISDNDDDGNEQTRICYVMYGGNYGYHPRGPGQSHWHEEQPGVVHKVLRTGFGSPTGMCWYEGTMLRDALLKQSVASDQQSANKEKKAEPYGLLLHCDAGPRQVRCYHVRAKGAGYELEQQVIAESTDNWFRPSDVCVAPDGSIFVSDWYDPGVGGHGMGDTTRGRIYRITPKAYHRYALPEFKSDEKGDWTAIAATKYCFSSPCLATRRLGIEGINLFAPRVKAEIVFGLPSIPAWLPARAAWHYEGFGSGSGNLRPPVEWVSVFEVRHLKNRFARQNFVPEIDALSHQTWRPAASHREILLSVRDCDPQRVEEAIFRLAKLYDPQDPFYLSAVGIAVGHHDQKRREVILADFEKHFPEWNDKVAKLVWELRPPEVIKKLPEQLADPQVPLKQKTQILDILASLDGSEHAHAIVKLAEIGRPGELRDQAVTNLLTHLPGKWSRLKQAPELRAAAEKLLASSETTPRLQGIYLVSASEMTGMTDRLVTIADNASELPWVRAAAVRHLSSLKTPASTDALVRLLKEESLRREAAQSLGKQGTPGALRALENLVRDEKQPIDLRQDAVAGLAGNRRGATWLLDVHAKKALPEALLPEASRLLRNSPHQDLRNRALMAFPPPRKIDPKKLPALSEFATRRGDAENGRQLVFNHKDLGCVRCHSIDNKGGNIGPDLASIGKKASRENLFESILLPDKAVADQFIQWTVETKQGLILTGLVVEDAPEHLLVRDALGKDTRVLKSEIEKRAKSPKSIMPDDLLAYMTEQDLADIVEYLSTLK